MAKLPTVNWNQTSGQHLTLIGNSKYLRLTGGQQYRIRIVSSPYRFFKIFRRIGGRVLTAITDTKTGVNLPDGTIPTERYALYILDRADGKIKLLEAPLSIVRSIANHAEVTGCNPTDPDHGSDYVIKVDGTGMNTRYSVTPLMETPLTDADKNAVKITSEDPLHILYKGHTPEQIQERLLL